METETATGRRSLLSSKLKSRGSSIRLESQLCWSLNFAEHFPEFHFEFSLFLFLDEVSIKGTLFELRRYLLSEVFLPLRMLQEIPKFLGCLG